MARMKDTTNKGVENVAKKRDALAKKEKKVDKEEKAKSKPKSKEKSKVKTKISRAKSQKPRKITKTVLDSSICQKCRQR